MSTKNTGSNLEPAGEYPAVFVCELKKEKTTPKCRFKVKDHVQEFLQLVLLPVLLSLRVFPRVVCQT